MNHQKLKKIINNHADKILSLSIILYIVLFSLISFWKYFNFYYNGLDLAIFNQVFYNSSFGRFFEFSIHPHSYLGDHFTPFLLLLTPLYALWRSPLTLLIIQTVFLALAAWPLYLIAKLFWRQSRGLPLLISLLWLANPLVQNINLFEFHLLALLPFLLYYTFYFFQTQKFWKFLTLALLSLSLREDVSLIIFMFGVLALINLKKTTLLDSWRKNYQWILTPLVLSGLWFIIALKITGYFNPEGHYKFLYYYAHLGNSLGEIVKNIFSQPFYSLKHLIKLGNLEMILGLLLPLGFLPLIKPKYLLLSLGIFLAIVLGAAGGSSFVLSSHYAAGFLAPLFIAALAALVQLLKKPPQWKFLPIVQERWIIISYLIIATFYSSLTLGPLAGVAKQFQIENQTNEIKKQFLDQIPVEAAVATTYELLPHLSSREKIYSLNYIFIGQKQFSEKNYILPEETEYLLIDFEDFITYALQYPTLLTYSASYDRGDERMRALFEERNFGLVKIEDTLALFKKNHPQTEKIYSLEAQSPASSEIILANKIKFLGWEKQGAKFSFYWQALEKIDQNYQLELEIEKAVKIYPLAYGVYPTSQWLPQEIIKTNYWFSEEQIKNLSAGELKISLIKIEGQIVVDEIRSIKNVITAREILGEKIILDLET